MDGRSPRNHKTLDVWQRAMVLAEATYRATKDFPPEERFGLSMQMRRAAVSILSNISEGAARKSRAEYLQFLHIARGSLSELEAQQLLAVRLRFGADDCSSLNNEIRRVSQLLNAQIMALRRVAQQ